MREYEVTINELPHTLQLNEEDAKRWPGAKPVQRKQADEPSNKSRSVKNK